MHKADTLESIEHLRETPQERVLKSAISDLQNALFRTRHGEACGEQVSKAWNKLGDFMAAEALAKVRDYVKPEDEHILWDNLEAKHLNNIKN